MEIVDSRIEFYPDTINAAFERLKKGGIFVTDNSLLNGMELH